MLREKEKKETSAPAEGSWGCERCSEMALTGLAAALAPAQHSSYYTGT